MRSQDFVKGVPSPSGVQGQSPVGVWGQSPEKPEKTVKKHTLKQLKIQKNEILGRFIMWSNRIN